MSRLQFFKVYSRSRQYLNHNTLHQLVTSATSLPHHCYQPGHQQTFESKSIQEPQTPDIPWLENDTSSTVR